MLFSIRHNRPILRLVLAWAHLHRELEASKKTIKKGAKNAQTLNSLHVLCIRFTVTHSRAFFFGGDFVFFFCG